MESLYIVIPAYNEEANIRNVVDDWYAIVEKHSANGQSRLCVIDDGSSDNTYGILKEYASSHPLLKPITKKNEGHGATILYGYRYAIDHGADYIFQTDSDGQTLPEEFQQFWDLRNEYDVVMGHRNNREDGLSRIVVTKVLKFVLFLIFGIKVTDANVPYRLMREEVLQKYIDRVPEGFNLSNILLTVFFIKGNEKLKFLPITFRPRQGGKNSINLPKIIRIGFNSVRDFLSIKKKYKL